MPAVRQAGNEVYVWTVNDPADLELVLDVGVEGIITDRPRLVLDRLGRWPARGRPAGPPTGCGVTGFGVTG